MKLGGQFEKICSDGLKAVSSEVLAKLALFSVARAEQIMKHNMDTMIAGQYSNTYELDFYAGIVGVTIRNQLLEFQKG